MPAVSAKQQRYMGMCAHNPKAGCPSQQVAEEFAHKPSGGYKKPKPNYAHMAKKLLGK